MAYTAWSVVYGEQPTAAKWNQLGENDAGFRDGTNILDDAIIARHIAGFDKSNLTTDSNPYRFSAHASTTVAISTATQKVALNTKLFDPNNNFNTASYRYTAPVAGFYQINAQARMGSAGMGSTENAMLAIHKNGIEHVVSDKINGSNDANRIANPNISKQIQLAAGDYLELFAVMGGVYRDIVGSSATTFMDGYLVSRT